MASYSLCEFDYDPIDVLQGIFVLTSGGQHFWPMKHLSSFLRAGSRLGFRVNHYGSQRLEQYGEQHTIPGFATFLTVGTGRFHEADMSGTGPTRPNSLVGVVHRVLVAQGSKPTWTTHPDLYRGPFGKCGRRGPASGRRASRSPPGRCKPPRPG